MPLVPLLLTAISMHHVSSLKVGGSFQCRLLATSAGGVYGARFQFSDYQLRFLDGIRSRYRLIASHHT
jgi:hypothetical protein